MAAKLPSIPTITNDLANHVKALQAIKGILEGAGLSGSNLETALAAYLLSPDPIGGITPNKGTFSTLTLTTPVATPAAGQVGAGDITPIGFPFVGNWGNFGAGYRASSYMKLPSGFIFVLCNMTSSAANDNTKAGTLPALYRPSQNVRGAIVDSTGLVAGQIHINNSGDFFPNIGSAAPQSWLGWILFRAEQ